MLKTRTRAYLWTLFAVLMILCSPVLTFAQGSDPGAPDPTFEGLSVALVTVVGAASVSLVTALVKKLAPGIPRIAIPTLIVPALGVLAAWLPSYATHGHFSGLKAALFTLGALYLRETLSTLAEHGTAPTAKAFGLVVLGLLGLPALGHASTVVRTIPPGEYRHGRDLARELQRASEAVVEYDEAARTFRMHPHPELMPTCPTACHPGRR